MRAEYGSNEAERRSIDAAREELLLTAADSIQESLSVDALDNRVKILAALSLTQEGYFRMRPKDSDDLVLTDAGLRFALGAKAFSRS